MNDFIAWDTVNYDCPVPPETVVEVTDVGGHRKIGKAREWYWFFQGWSTDVANYRIIEAQRSS